MGDVYSSWEGPGGWQLRAARATALVRPQADLMSTYNTKFNEYQVTLEIT